MHKKNAQKKCTKKMHKKNAQKKMHIKAVHKKCTFCKIHANFYL